MVISHPQASIYLCLSSPLEPNLLLFSITILSISSLCENTPTQSIPPIPPRLGHSTSSPRQMTMSAVAASTGSPNERRASASRSFSQSQDENTKLPDEMMSPDLQQVRIFVHVSGSFFGLGKLLSSPTAGSPEPCRPPDVNELRHTWDENHYSGLPAVGTKPLIPRPPNTCPAHSHISIDSATSGSQIFFSPT